MPRERSAPPAAVGRYTMVLPTAMTAPLLAPELLPAADRQA